MTKTLFTSAIAATGLVAALGLSSGAQAEEAQVIELTQTPCQFVEVETSDHGYAPRPARPIAKPINAKSWR